MDGDGVRPASPRPRHGRTSQQVLNISGWELGPFRRPNAIRRSKQTRRLHIAIIRRHKEWRNDTEGATLTRRDTIPGAKVGSCVAHVIINGGTRRGSHNDRGLQYGQRRAGGAGQLCRQHFRHRDRHCGGKADRRGGIRGFQLVIHTTTDANGLYRVTTVPIDSPGLDEIADATNPGYQPQTKKIHVAAAGQQYEVDFQRRSHPLRRFAFRRNRPENP